MGRKTNSVSLRLNKTNRNYNNCWYSDILYADNFSNTLKLGNYLSQTLKTIDMPCAQTSTIGAYKKANFFVCYLDPKKRVRLLEKSGVRSNTSFLSLNKKIKQDPKILNPLVAQKLFLEPSLEAELNGSFEVSSALQTEDAQITNHSNTNVNNSKQIKNQIKAEQNQTASLQVLNPGLTTKDNKVMPFKGVVDPIRGLITLSPKRTPLCLAGVSFATPKGVAPKGHRRLGKGLALPNCEKTPRDPKINRQYFFEKACNLANPKNGFLGGLQTLENDKPKPCSHNGINSTEQDFRRYFSYRGPLGLEMSLQLLDLHLTDMPFQGQEGYGRAEQGLPSSAPKAIQDARLSQNHVLLASNTFPCFLKKNFLGKQNYLIRSRSTTLQKVQDTESFLGQAPKQNNSLLSIGPGIFPSILEIFPEKFSRFKYFFEEFFYGIGTDGPCKAWAMGSPNLTMRAKKGHGLVPIQQKTSKKVVTEKISLVCAFYKNMFIYGGKNCSNSYIFGSRLCTFSSRLISNNCYRNPYCKNALVYEKPVYVLKNSQSASLNSLYGFYDSFSRFWGNFVFLSFYKSTNETCCALFLADTVAYLLERKVLFRSIKRQLLILLNNSKKSFAVSKNLLSKLFTVNKNKKVIGIRISCSGRVGGRSKKAQRSRKDTFMWGETGLNVFSSKLDFAKTHAETPFGTVGVQVWVCTK